VGAGGTDQTYQDVGPEAFDILDLLVQLLESDITVLRGEFGLSVLLLGSN